MSATAKALGTSAPPHTFDHAGRTYKLRLVDWDMGVELERHLYDVRAAALEVLRKRMDSAAYQERLDELTRQYEDGEFDLQAPQGKAYYMGEPEEPLADPDDGENAARTKRNLDSARKALKGRIYFASLIFGTTSSDMMRLLRQCGPEVMTRLALVIRESRLVETVEDDEGEPDAAAAMAALAGAAVPNAAVPAG